MKILPGDENSRKFDENQTKSTDAIDQPYIIDVDQYNQRPEMSVLPGKNCCDDVTLKTSQQQSKPMTFSRKRVIFALVAMVTIMVVILLAFCITSLVTVKILVQETEQMERNDRLIEQERYVDSSEDILQYFIESKNGDEKTWVIIDNNREIEIVKIERNSDVVCYVSPILVLDDKTPSPDSNMADTDETQRTITTSVQPIKDLSILGSRGQKLCQSAKVYWSVRVNPNSGSTPPSSQTSGKSGVVTSTISAKPFPANRGSPDQTDGVSDPVGTDSSTVGSRQVNRSRRSFQVYGCWWDWTRCHFYIFPGDTSQVQYYFCDITCGVYTQQ